jgi:hypothetical protein
VATADGFEQVGALYIDAMNVIGSRPDGWWRDRDGAVRRLAHRLQALAAERDAEIVLVVDGRPSPSLPEGTNGQLSVCYARRPGPDAADDRIIELLETRQPEAAERSTGDRLPPAVVTADRELGVRAATSGAHVIGPRRLLDLLSRLPVDPT